LTPQGAPYFSNCVGFWRVRRLDRLPAPRLCRLFLLQGLGKFAQERGDTADVHGSPRAATASGVRKSASVIWCPALRLTAVYVGINFVQGILVQMTNLSRDLSPEQSQFLRALIERELVPRIPKQYQLAAAVGMAQGNFFHFMSGTKGASIVLALRVAYLLNQPVEDVLGLPRIPAFVDDQERRYPTRILAARVAYLEGIPARRILQVLSSSMRYDGDPGVEWWVKIMRSKALASSGSKEHTDWALKLVNPDAISAPPRKKVKPKAHK
jgi:hypothetical protein